MNDIVVSLHARERFLERYDIELAEKCNCMADRAWRNGRTPDCFSGRMRKYLFDIKNRERPDVVLKVHAKNCWMRLLHYLKR